jgi:hypothetical protein
MDNLVNGAKAGVRITYTVFLLLMLAMMILVPLYILFIPS